MAFLHFAMPNFKHIKETQLPKTMLIAALFVLLFRFIASFTINLGVDEAYYFSYIQFPQISFYDHPPMVAIMLWLTTLNQLLPSEFFMRLGPLLIGTLNLFIIFRIGTEIQNKRTGLLAAALASASLYNSIISGLFVLPDTPLSMFWLFALWSAILFIKNRQTKHLFLFGLFAGLALVSKYHGLFLWMGMGLYILAHQRHELRKPRLYLAWALTIAIFSPVLIWNADNNWESFIFQGSRALSFHFKPLTLAAELFGQFAYNNPISVVILVLLYIPFFKNYRTQSTHIQSVLLWFSLPLILLVVILSLFNRTQPHWTGPAYYALILVAASLLDRMPLLQLNKFIKGINAANWLLVATILVGIVHSNVGLLPSLPNKNIETMGQYDFSIDMYGWQQVESKIDSLLKAEKISDPSFEADFLMSRNWFPAGHLHYYVSTPLQKPLYVCGTLGERHHFKHVNEKIGPISKGNDGLFIQLSQYPRPFPNLLYNHFGRVESLQPFMIYRRGKPVYTIFTYKLHQAKTEIDVNTLAPFEEK